MSRPPNDYIPLRSCQTGMAYRLDSRQLAVGVYDGAEGFIGIRDKFGRRYLFTEYHWDQGPPHGTAFPIEALEPYSSQLDEQSPELFDWLDQLELRTGYCNPPAPNNLALARAKWLTQQNSERKGIEL